MPNIKSKKEIAVMREGGKRLAGIMQEIGRKIQVGLNTLELDKLAEKLVFDNGGRPSFKNYGQESETPFPATICASINNEVVHGIPKKKAVLKNGDILKIDIGMEYAGRHVDMARTFAVGNVSKEAERLIEATRDSLEDGIKKIKAGNNMSEYSIAVQKRVEQNGFSIVRSLVGHGIGKKLHEPPQIPNYYEKNYRDVRLESGMALALEPMVNEGGFEITLAEDKWTFKTKDGKLSAHFEDTVMVTDNGAEILTRL